MYILTWRLPTAPSIFHHHEWLQSAKWMWLICESAKQCMVSFPIQALWWSKSGQYLAFLTIDDRQVEQIQFPVFQRKQYPSMNSVPYPKTGVERLPRIALSIWNKATKEIRRMHVALRHER